MPPKNKKQKEIVQDERFQAIVLTDSFETRFMPLTSVKPRCLLPLANVPLLEYTLEFLAKAGVNEVYLMCSSHADQIEEYIQKSKWQSQGSFTIKTVMSLESRSVGDAMRDLDNRGLITGDFLLVSGDVVTNIDFEKVMSVHKHKKLLDKEHIVTMVLAPASPLHKTRSQVDPAAFILDKKTDRCLYFQDIPSVDGRKTSINIDPELLEDIEDEFVVRNDLIDCHVDICSPHVPQIFQENFDYQTLRSDFIKGVLTSDLVKKTIYAYITDGTEYSARVESWATYDAVSQDILARWCYPLVPDSNLLENNSYTYESNHIYKEEKVVLAQSCKIGSRTAIGRGTTVGEKTTVSRSVVGKNCVIGANVTIEGLYIWDNAVIDDNCVVKNSIVATGAHLRKNARLGPGSVVGFNVVVGENKTIPSNARILDVPVSKAGFERESSFDSDNDDAEDAAAPVLEVNDIDLVGEDGVGLLYVSDRDLDDESELESVSVSSYKQYGMVYQMGLLNVSDDSIASVSARRVKRHMRHGSRTRRFSATSVVSTDVDGVYSEEEEEDFNKEAVDTVTRALENNHDLDTALLELNTLRMSMNVTYHEVRLATCHALLTRIVHFVATDTLDVKEATTKLFKEWGSMFKRQLFGDEEQVDLAQILQTKCAALSPTYNQVVLFIALRQLYEQDILDEDAILAWWDSAASSATADLVEVRTVAAQFVNWLREADEEDSDDE